MLGSILGVAVAVGLVRLALIGDLEDAFLGPWNLVGITAGYALGSYLLGFVPKFAIGRLVLWIMIGAVVSALIAPFTGQAQYAPALAVLGLSGWAVQIVQVRRTSSDSRARDCAMDPRTPARVQPPIRHTYAYGYRHGVRDRLENVARNHIGVGEEILWREFRPYNDGEHGLALLTNRRLVEVSSTQESEPIVSDLSRLELIYDMPVVSPNLMGVILRPVRPGPEGQTWFQYEDSSFRVEFFHVISSVAPSDCAWRLAPHRLDLLRETPVVEWANCPACGAGMGTRTNNAVRCSNCARYFADEKFAPLLSKDAGDGKAYGELLGSTPLERHSVAHLAYRGLPVAWISPTHPFLPSGMDPFVDRELMERALDLKRGFPRDGEAWQWWLKADTSDK